jgi:hypothetical protein
MTNLKSLAIIGRIGRFSGRYGLCLPLPSSYNFPFSEQAGSLHDASESFNLFALRAIGLPHEPHVRSPVFVSNLGAII